ncbi:hypothetical protein PV721_25365 [Streptomyces sp. MB09-01]|uniref:hypothetical protein n=1 Tax=Streptomyces sp. MB09-01 TaxID=3028666 RepID=UPI0029A42D57|nr:hypothetical protein [Streptomyces sp. MB09-01]MDX3537639.1 hypothetical protein [Streptomyces sp. MB09-01]
MGIFVPSSGTIRVGGSGCSGGAARSFYTQLVKTSGSSKVFSSYSYAADGQHQTDPRGIGVSTSTSYYLRWYGKNNSGAASAPCASAHTAWPGRLGSRPAPGQGPAVLHGCGKGTQ